MLRAFNARICGAVRAPSVRRSIASTQTDLHPKFLRENTWEAWDSSSRQRLDFNLDPDIKVVSQEMIPGAEAAMRVGFSDGHVGRFDASPPPEQLWGDDLPNRARKLWGASDGATYSADKITAQLGHDGPLRFHHDSLCEGAALRDWAEAMQTYGITVVQGVPVQEDAVIGFGNRTFGYVFPTSYGYKFTVKAEERPNNLAYSDQGIQQHTDLPYYSIPPSIQLFHCLTKAQAGGESFFLDGFDAAATLWEQDPHAFAVLSKQQVRFQDLTATWHHTARHPTFLLKDGSESGGPSALHRVCFNERARDSWREVDQSSASQAEFYKALAAYERIVEDRSRYVRILLEPGEMICVDNWRLMHSRGSFTGARHLEGAYLDWDAVYAVWRASGTQLSMPQWPSA